MEGEDGKDGGRWLECRDCYNGIEAEMSPGCMRAWMGGRRKPSNNASEHKMNARRSILNYLN